MPMLDALNYAARQAEQHQAQERAHRAAQEGAQALQRARAELLAAEMAKARSQPVEPAGVSETVMSQTDAAMTGLSDSGSQSPQSECLIDIARARVARVTRGSESTPARQAASEIDLRYDRYAQLIAELARITLAFPNPEAWRLLVDAGKVRGLSPVEAVNLRPRIWKVRKRMQKETKIRLRAAARGDR
jgi:hypothetical protein